MNSIFQITFLNSLFYTESSFDPKEKNTFVIFLYVLMRPLCGLYCS